MGRPTSKGRKRKGGEEREGKRGRKERGGQERRKGEGEEGKGGRRGEGCPVFLLSRPDNPSC